MKLTQEALCEIKTNLRLRNRLAFELNKAPMTISRWVAANDINLTQDIALKIISEETGLASREILDSEVVRA